MKKFAVFILLLIFCCGQVWGAQDTLQPAADQSVLWTHVGCEEGSYYQCMDDPPGSPDSTVTYAHTTTADNLEHFRVESTFVSDIDSVVIRINAEKTGENIKLYVGWAYYTEGFWTFEEDDSVTLTDSWADYSVNADNEPSWTYQEINARRFGVRSGHIAPVPPDSFGLTSATGSKRISGGYVSHYRYQADFTGTVDTLSLDCHNVNVSSQCKIAIYSDSGVSHYPYQLLDSCAEFTMAQGWNREALVNGNVSVTNGSWYWLAFRFETTGDTIHTESEVGVGYWKAYSFDDGWEAIYSEGTAENAWYNFLAIDGGIEVDQHLTQVFVIVYYPEAGEEEGSPRRRKILQLEGVIR